MKQLDLTILFVSVSLGLQTGLLQAQRNLDVGVFFGVSHYMGDLHQSTIEVLEINQAKGAFLRYNLNNTFSIKANFFQGTLSGSDANYPTIESAAQRNLSFRSNIYEAGIQGELNFINCGEKTRTGPKPTVRYLTSAYLFGGVSGFYFNPQTFYQGQWHDLQPLGTEGQGLAGHPEKYSRFQIAIPMGFGFKVRPNRRSCMGVEFGLRRTFTDHLDDVGGPYPDLKALREATPLAAALSYRGAEADPSAPTAPPGSPRGNPNDKDMYFFAGFMLAITLGK